MKTVLVFGTFDGIHKGHGNFFQQAKKLGDNIIISLAQDSVVQELKGNKPSTPFKQRKLDLLEHSNVSQVIPGDLDLGTFRAVSIVQPDIIAMGYDQIELKSKLEQWMYKYQISIPVVQLDPFKPEIYKSSLIRKIT